MFPPSLPYWDECLLNLPVAAIYQRVSCFYCRRFGFFPRNNRSWKQKERTHMISLKEFKWVPDQEEMECQPSLVPPRYRFETLCTGTSKVSVEKSSRNFDPLTVWCVINVFHKNDMRPLIIANVTKCYSILYCNSPRLYFRLKYIISVISVKLNWLPGNSKKWTI